MQVDVQTKFSIGDRAHVIHNGTVVQVYVTNVIVDVSKEDTVISYKVDDSEIQVVREHQLFN